MQHGKSSAWYLAGVALLGTGLSGCAFVPTPVRLLNKPHVTEKQPDCGVKLCLIVRDERPQAIQQSNMCGVMRNLYMIPTSFAFLAHREHLDEILAHHMKANLEHQGYAVVAAYPKPPSELNPDELKAKELNKEAQKTAWWKDRASQEDRESKRAGLKGGIEQLDEEYVSAWGPDVDTACADAVVEVKVRKFWSDMGWGIDVGGVFAWMSANIAVCDPNDPDRRVVFGKKVRGFGHGRGLTPIEAYGVPINTAYWFVLHEIEKICASEEFQDAVADLRRARKRNP